MSVKTTAVLIATSFAFTAMMPTGQIAGDPMSGLIAAAHAQQGQDQGGTQGRNGQAGGQQNQTENQNQNENRNQNRNQGPQDGDGTGPGVGVILKEDAKELDSHACFYADRDFKGAVFCASEGGYSQFLPTGWNDRISSIEIVGSVTVEVCADPGYAGFCAEFTASTAVLPSELDDAISSWRIK